MGLDMYLTGRKFFWRTWENDGGDRKEDGKIIKNLDVELGYWRKHPNLHGYIVKTFAKGKDDCKEIGLSADDLRGVIAAVKARQLPHTSGFFFGESDPRDETVENDVRVLTEALEWLEAGDEEPFEHETPIEGPGFTAVVIKPKPGKAKGQKVTRTVNYRGDW